MALIWGSNSSDTLTGKRSADFIFGQAGDDTIDGRRGKDFIHAGQGDDTVRGSHGDDFIIGGKGTDTAQYRGDLSDYKITQNDDGSLTIQDLRSCGKHTSDGSDTVRSVENFQFADGIRSLDDILNPERADGFDFTLRIVDPNGLATAQNDAILANMDAAVGNWAKYISGDGSIDIDIVITEDAGTASASSTTNIEVGMSNGKTVFRDSAPYELITGTDLNGADADARVNLPVDYLLNELWLDPNPTSRTAPVPTDKTDAVSVFEHEFGHVLGMTGFGGPDGILSGDAASVYDSLITFQNGNPVFNGQATIDYFGRPLPLSNPLQGDVNNYTHYGHETSDGLDDNLMEGNTFYMRGFRYNIEQVDLAIMKDMGLNVGDGWMTA